MELSSNEEVQKLVEWVAAKIVPRYTCEGCEWQHKDAPHCSGATEPNEPCEYQYSEARKILLAPKLALMVKKELPENPYVFHGGGDGRVWNYHKQRAQGFSRCLEVMLKWHNDSIIPLVKE